MTGDGETGTVLVVDDDATMRAILRHLLEMEGWAVEEAGDGVQALAAYRSTHPDLVLTDLEMPRMTGEELARRLRDEDGDGVPVVAVSRRAPRTGAADLFDDVLRKPVTRRALRGWLSP